MKYHQNYKVWSTEHGTEGWATDVVATSAEEAAARYMEPEFDGMRPFEGVFTRNGSVSVRDLTTGGLQQFKIRASYKLVVEAESLVGE